MKTGSVVRPEASTHPTATSRPCDGAGIDSMPELHRHHGSTGAMPHQPANEPAASNRSLHRLNHATATVKHARFGLESFGATHRFLVDGPQLSPACTVFDAEVAQLLRA